MGNPPDNDKMIDWGHRVAYVAMTTCKPATDVKKRLLFRLILSFLNIL